jgi:hypothetical protein
MMKNIFLTIVLLSFIPSFTFSQAIYDVESRLLSVESGGRLLSEILAEISQETGIEIFINPNVDKKVFAIIQRQQLESAIKRMIKPLNNILIYEGDSIVAVKIFETSYTEATLKIAPIRETIDIPPSPAENKNESIQKIGQKKIMEETVAERRKELMKRPQFQRAMEEISAMPLAPGEEPPDPIPPHLLYGPRDDEKPHLTEEASEDMAAEQERNRPLHLLQPQE